MSYVALAAAALNAVGKKSGAGGTAGDIEGGTSDGRADVDFSGFTASTGSSKAYGATIKKGQAEDGLSALTDAMPGNLVSPVGLLILGGLGLVVVWSLARKRK